MRCQRYRAEKLALTMRASDVLSEKARRESVARVFDERKYETIYSIYSTERLSTRSRGVRSRERPSPRTSCGQTEHCA